MQQYYRNIEIFSNFTVYFSELKKKSALRDYKRSDMILKALLSFVNNSKRSNVMYQNFQSYFSVISKTQ